MKKTTQLFGAAVLLFSLFWLSNSTGALPQNTGAPNELTCGRAPCHNIPANVGDAEISIRVGNDATTYQPDEVLPLMVSISNAQSARNGFQLVALDEDNQNVGAWILTAPAEMKIIDGIGLPRKYVTHQAAGSLQNSWSLDWQAPDANRGNITFYASVLDANNNGFNTGDAVYTTSDTLAFDISSGIDTPAAPLAARTYPNPVRGHLWIDNPGQKPLRATLFNSHGSFVSQWMAPVGKSNQALGGLPDGIYFLALEEGGRRSVERITVW